MVTEMQKGMLCLSQIKTLCMYVYTAITSPNMSTTELISIPLLKVVTDVIILQPLIKHIEYKMQFVLLQYSNCEECLMSYNHHLKHCYDVFLQVVCISGANMWKSKLVFVWVCWIRCDYRTLLQAMHLYYVYSI